MCQGRQGWTELGALVLGQPRTPVLQGWPVPLVPRGLYHPSKWHELAQPQPPDPCTYGVQGAGEPAPQTTAVQGRPRETSRRKEPPGLWPPQEPPCRVHSRWPQVPPQRERR